jgi:phenylalanyl-tRNA synthetase beta chain
LIKDHELVNDVTIFDVYVGSGVPEGKRSIALRIHFKSPHRTLTSKVISDAEGEIMNRLVKEVGVELRS